jgi:predicted amino acid racemase
MTAPRIEVDLDKIRYNARRLVQRLGQDGIAVTAVTKAVCGHPDIARAMMDGGVTGLADAHIENVERMRRSGVTSPIWLIRTPMISQADRVIHACNASYNTELDAIHKLAESALRANVVHGVILMVEMGDHREGIMPGDLDSIARKVVMIPGVDLMGIGANFACLGGAAPDQHAMTELSSLANKIDGARGARLRVVSGGNSSNLTFIDNGGRSGRVNDLRVGEAILLGVDPISSDAIDGLCTDAFTLVAEVIETNIRARNGSDLLEALPGGQRSKVPPEDICIRQSIVALGLQDTDVEGLSLPSEYGAIGATSDHFIVETPGARLPIGAEITFQPNYSALMRAMAAPNIAKVMRNGRLHGQDVEKRLSPEKIGVNLKG